MLEPVKRALGARPVDIEQALQGFSDSTREEYRQIFSTMGNGVKALAAELRDIRKEYGDNFSAIYTYGRESTIEGQTSIQLFKVRFVRSGEGRWLIDHF